MLPLEEHGFCLSKAAFRDALYLRYNWPLKDVSSHCVCGKTFSVEHCLSCPAGGFPAIRDKEVRDINAEKLTEVCSNIEVEPHLQRLSGELLALRTSISGDEDKLDISANEVWGGRFEKAFIDVRVFNPCTKSKSGTLLSVYRKHEVGKNRCYEQRIREVEYSSFTPLVLSCTGGMGKLATTFYKRLASMIREKNNFA